METRNYCLIRCHKCGDYTPTSHFCRQCGSRFDRIMNAEMDTAECPHCGEVICDGKYCGVCGELLHEQ